MKHQPYRLAAENYPSLGSFFDVIPVDGKEMFLKGYTGGKAQPITRALIDEWARRWPGANVAGVLRVGFLGIDVDMYDGKLGKATLADLEKRNGRLPATPMSTSRDDGSGIRFFRVDPEIKWRGIAGPGIELISHVYRYAIVSPSVHPRTGALYRWVTAKGEHVYDWFPGPEDLAELPASWVEALQDDGSAREDGRHEGSALVGEVRTVAEERLLAGAMCPDTERVVAGWLLRLADAGAGGGAHDEAVRAVHAIVEDAAQGHRGCGAALKQVRAAFLEAVAGRRTTREAKAEWARLLQGALDTVLVAGLDVDGLVDPCEDFAAIEDGEWGPAEGRVGVNYEPNDVGNALRLVDRLQGRIRYLRATKAWYTWDENAGVWVHDDEWAAREVIAIADDIASQARELLNYDPKSTEGRELRRWAVQTGNSSRIRSALDALAVMDGITIDDSAFDSDKHLLTCANGTLELRGGTAGGEQAVLREHRVADYCRVRVPRRYLGRGVYGKKFTALLDMVMPDEDEQAALQSLLGSSLQVGNPERRFVFVKGPSQTGKSTFFNLLARALGKQVMGTYNVSMFREKTDGPRPDLMKSISRRIIFATETSDEVRLHADVIKRATGDDILEARALYSNEFVERSAAFTPYVVTNHAPTINGADHALATRLLLVPFREVHSEDEWARWFAMPDSEGSAGAGSGEEAALGDGLGDGASEFLDGVFTWVVDGWGLPWEQPESWSMDQQEFMEELSWILQFVESECLPDAEATVPFGELYERLEMWWRDQGKHDKVPTKTAVGRSLRDVGYGERKVRVGSRQDDRKIVVRTGLRLR